MGCGKGNGEGSKRGHFVTRTTCSRCDVTLTQDNRYFGKCKPCARSDQRAASKRCVGSIEAANNRRERDRVRDKDVGRRSKNNVAKKAWVLANKERDNASHAVRQSRRRARQAGNGGDVTAVEWKEQLEVFGHCCAYCLRSDLPLQMEHVIPIARGGPHTIENVVPSCGPCNFRKHARGPLSLVNRAFEKVA